MQPVRVLVPVAVAIAAALLMAPKPVLPSADELQGRLVQIVAPGDDEADPAAPAAQIRRVSAGGHDYGACSGLIAAVLLEPEPCEAVWLGPPDPVQPTPAMRLRPSPERSD